MSYRNIFQTPKAQMFTECKIPRAWTTNIHLQRIPLMYLAPPEAAVYEGWETLSQLLCDFVFIT